MPDPTQARLDWNESPIGPPAGAVARLVAGADRLHLYPRGLHQEVTAAIARRWRVPDAAVLLTGGVDDATDLVLSITDSVWCTVPGFDGYRHRASVFGRTVRDIPLDDDWQPVPPPAAFRAGGAVLLAQPNNPTGNLFDQRWLALVAGEAELVMIDETYRHFSDDECAVSQLVTRRDNLLVFTSFSKEYGLAGVRLGVLVGSPKLIKMLGERQRFHPVDSISLYAAQGALDDPTHLANLRSYTDQARPRYQAALSACPLIVEVRPAKANFVLARCAESIDSCQLATALATHGVWVKDCTELGLPGWLRVTIGTAANLDLLIKALDAVTAPDHRGKVRQDPIFAEPWAMG